MYKMSFCRKKVSIRCIWRFLYRMFFLCLLQSNIPSSWGCILAAWHTRRNSIWLYYYDYVAIDVIQIDFATFGTFLVENTFHFVWNWTHWEKKSSWKEASIILEMSFVRPTLLFEGHEFLSNCIASFEQRFSLKVSRCFFLEAEAFVHVCNCFQTEKGIYQGNIGLRFGSQPCRGPLVPFGSFRSSRTDSVGGPAGSEKCGDASL